MKKILDEEEFRQYVAEQNSDMTEEQLTQHLIDLDPNDYGYAEEEILKYDCDKKSLIVYRKIE